MPEERPDEMRQEEESKGLECCWRSDRIDAFAWAAIFIWGGQVLLAGATGFAANFTWWNGWSVFLTGAGVIVLIEAGVRLLVPEHRQPLVWNLICGFILLGFGLGDTAWRWVLPLVLIVIGLTVFRGALARRR